ncbi:hypothetical protein Tco_1201157 [Tanacetum coccineum]
MQNIFRIVSKVKKSCEAVDLGEIQEEKIQHLLKSLEHPPEVSVLTTTRGSDSDSKYAQWIGRTPKQSTTASLHRNLNTIASSKAAMEAVWIGNLSSGAG